VSLQVEKPQFNKVIADFIGQARKRLRQAEFLQQVLIVVPVLFWLSAIAFVVAIFSLNHSVLGAIYLMLIALAVMLPIILLALWYVVDLQISTASLAEQLDRTFDAKDSFKTLLQPDLSIAPGSNNIAFVYTQQQLEQQLLSFNLESEFRVKLNNLTRRLWLSVLIIPALLVLISFVYLARLPELPSEYYQLKSLAQKKVLEPEIQKTVEQLVQNLEQLPIEDLALSKNIIDLEQQLSKSTQASSDSTTAEAEQLKSKETNPLDSQPAQSATPTATPKPKQQESQKQSDQQSDPPNESEQKQQAEGGSDKKDSSESSKSDQSQQGDQGEQGQSEKEKAAQQSESKQGQEQGSEGQGNKEGDSKNKNGSGEGQDQKESKDGSKEGSSKSDSGNAAGEQKADSKQGAGSKAEQELQSALGSLKDKISKQADQKQDSKNQSGQQKSDSKQGQEPDSKPQGKQAGKQSSPSENKDQQGDKGEGSSDSTGQSGQKKDQAQKDQTEGASPEGKGQSPSGSQQEQKPAIKPDDSAKQPQDSGGGGEGAASESQDKKESDSKKAGSASGAAGDPQPQESGKPGSGVSGPVGYTDISIAADPKKADLKNIGTTVGTAKDNKGGVYRTDQKDLPTEKPIVSIDISKQPIPLEYQNELAPSVSTDR
jgi:hypothetical protein